MNKILLTLSLVLMFSYSFATQPNAADPQFEDIEVLEETQPIKPVTKPAEVAKPAQVRTPTKVTDTIPQHKSQENQETTIVFMRSKMMAVLVKSSVYEITNSGTKFIGILKNNKKITYKTTAGEHTFMVIAESADFMQADLIAGKTYYSKIEPRMGALKARFSMYPIRNDGYSKVHIGNKKFDKMVYKSEEVVLSQKAIDWYHKKQKKFEKKRVKYWKKWLKKSAEKRAEKTMNPEDGV